MEEIKDKLNGYGSLYEKRAALQSDVPQISAVAGSSVSQYRKEQLSEDIRNGVLREGTSSISANANNSSLGRVTYSGKSIKKIAQSYGDSGSYSGTGGMFGATAGNTVMQAPEVYSPLWLNSNMSLPRDRATINAWCRSFFALNPFVHNAISLHSTYPISKLNIKCANKDIEKFFNDMIEEIDLMNVCVQIAQEYFLLGEAFPYAEFDENTGKWSRIHIQNPDLIVIKRTVIGNEPIIMLRPDENLKNIVKSNRPSDIEQRQQLSPQIIDSVKRGDNIRLDNFNVTQLARRVSPYEIRGTGLPVCIFRQLMLFDLLRESKFAQADGMINPTTVVKIGSPDYKPTMETLDAWRSTFEAAESNKNFKIFTHEAVDIQRVGFGSGIYDISPDITQLVKEIYTGLQVPSVLMDGGADTTYSNGSVALDVLRQRYMTFRNILGGWLKRKIFAPVSKIQGFYNYEGGEKQLIVPDIDWNYMSLFDANDYINNLMTLTQGGDDQRRASLHTLYRSMGLEYDDEIRKMRKESISAAIAKKEKASLDKMDLNALRSLNDEDEIPEPSDDESGSSDHSPGGGEAPVPGETGGLPDLNSTPPSMPPPNL